MRLNARRPHAFGAVSLMNEGNVRDSWTSILSQLGSTTDLFSKDLHLSAHAARAYIAGLQPGAVSRISCKAFGTAAG